MLRNSGSDSGATQPTKMAVPLKRKRKRTPPVHPSSSSCSDVGILETRQLKYPFSLSRAIVCCCLLAHALSFVTKSIPLASAFVPHYSQVSTEIKPYSERTIATTRSVKTRTRTTSSTTTLFGIKGFRAWFQDQFPDAVRTIDVSEQQDEFDHVLIDMNQILHVVLRRSDGMEQSTRRLMYELDSVIERIKPIHSLVLAIDGSPAAAKVGTQRKRRFSIIKNTEFKLKHSDKLRLSKRGRKKRLQSYKSELESLQLSPGTDCMKTMESAILYWAWQRVQTQNTPYARLGPNVRIYFSSSRVPGEGEIKLLEWINNFRGTLCRSPGQSIALYGGDADLCLEALVIPPSWTHNVFVMRPFESGNSSKGPTESKNSSNGNGKNKYAKNAESKKNAFVTRFRKNIIHCTSLWELTLNLDDYCRENLPKELYNPERHPFHQNLLLQIRTDMVLLFILNGNDYLPRVVAVGFRGVLRSYLSLLVKWIKAKGTTQNAGLVDPNTLNFRSHFCSEYFRWLGRDAPSERSRLKSMQKSKSKGRTYQAILNDMSGIGYIPTPIRFVEIKGEEIKLEADLNDDEEEIDDDDVDVDDDDEEEEDEEVPAAYHLKLLLGEEGEGDYHEYIVGVNSTSSESLQRAKALLAKKALREFDLLDNTDRMDFKGKDYAWEIETPAPANIPRYLAGLIWTLQTYQDGVCPTYHYNYGKCLAPSGRSIASYFEVAIKENRKVGAEELLGGFEIGGSVSAGVACLAALPSSVKHLIPEPYSQIGNEEIEDFYSQSMSPIDNLFDLKKFDKLINDELERLDLKETEKLINGELFADNSAWRLIKDISSQRNDGNMTSDSVNRWDRGILLGDHYWTCLTRSKKHFDFGFDPPLPPAESFSSLRPDKRIRVSRIISIDIPRRRHSINYTQLDIPSASFSKYPRKFWKVNNAKVDHNKFGSLTMYSNSTILKIPYKTAFDPEPKTNRGSHFKLLKSEGADIFEPQIDSNYDKKKDTKSQRPLGKKLKNRDRLKNRDQKSALDVLEMLVDMGLVGALTFTSGLDREFVVSVSFDATQDNLALQDMSFSYLTNPDDSIYWTKNHLASLVLDAILNPVKTTGSGEDANSQRTLWYDLTSEELKGILKNPPSLETSVKVNVQSMNSITILKQLWDLGLVQHYEFNVIPESKDRLETISLSLRMGSANKFENFECYRTRTQTKAWVKQMLASMALDSIISQGSSEKRWYDLSFETIKTHFKQRIELQL